MNTTQKTNQAVLEALKQFYGVYRGFAPTDESPIAMGELEITIDEAALKLRMATGLKIDSDEVPLYNLELMTKDDMREVYQEGSPFIDKSVGFKYRCIKFVFLPNPGDDIGLLVRGNEMADMLGPTVLWNPEQVGRGLYQKACEDLEKAEGPGCFPTLAANGRMPDTYKP
jgi:hypothetical protein